MRGDVLFFFDKSSRVEAEIESSWFGVILRYAREGCGSRLAYI